MRQSLSSAYTDTRKQRRRDGLKRSYEQIKRYLKEVRAAIQADRCRIEQSGRRPANQELCKNYVIDEAGIRRILLALTPEDFCKVLHNQHKGFEQELLYVFGKEAELIPRFGTGKEAVALYIKINKLNDQFVIIVSFHKQTYPLAYAFKP